MSDVDNKLGHASALIRSAMGMGLTHGDNKRLLRAVQEIAEVRSRLVTARTPTADSVANDWAVDGGGK